MDFQTTKSIVENTLKYMGWTFDNFSIRVVVPTYSEIYNEKGWVIDLLGDGVQDYELMTSSNFDSRYESIFEFAPFGIILSTVDGTIVDANQQIKNLLGVSPQELIGENVTMIYDVYDDLAKLPTEVITQIQTKGEIKQIKFESTFNKNVDLHMIVIRDVSEQIQLEKQMKHTQSLSMMGQLAASIAHEIRNPLTSLKGFTQLLANQVSTEGNRYLGIINGELSRMESILNEFLELAKPMKRSLQILSISSIINQVVEIMYPQAIIQNIELDFVSFDMESDLILGDAYELKKVMMNILKNAIEVMPNGGVITILQKLDKDNQLRVSVKDQGSGLTQDQMDKIFLPFYTSKNHGTGLGLAHAVQTVEDHSGRIEVESVMCEGAIFHLIFPFYQENALKESTEYDQSNGKSNWKVISSN
ncbi:ATP-binding protein [Paenisporosarcina indica]|uniref:ATP-binding protein n=1 Tax=Paenisporosarcina indica TaxID=650093 RepID=UPI000A02C7AF|nr:ATP-binding protein [Paenisporosarcina indica]